MSSVISGYSGNRKGSLRKNGTQGQTRFGRGIAIPLDGNFFDIRRCVEYPVSGNLLK